MFLTKYGTMWGSVPARQGRVFFVAPAASYVIDGRTYSASDDNDGLAPNRAKRTINSAMASCTANAGDTILLLAGTHTVTATQDLDVAGVSVVGMQAYYGGVGLRPLSTLSISGTADELINITASNVELGYLTLVGEGGTSTVSFQTAGALDNLHFHDLFVDMRYNDAISRDNRGIDFANRRGGTGTARMGTSISAEATAYLERITFWSNGANGEALLLATCSVRAQHLTFHNDAGTWATPVAVATSVDQSLMDACVWTSSGTMTVCVSGPQHNYAADTADSLSITNSRFTRNTATFATVFDGFGTQAISLGLADNLVMGGHGQANVPVTTTT